jgi:hypothetical protein
MPARCVQVLKQKCPSVHPDAQISSRRNWQEWHNIAESPLDFNREEGHLDKRKARKHMHFPRPKRRALQLPNYQITHLLNLLSWPECPEWIEVIELSKVVRGM